MIPFTIRAAGNRRHRAQVLLCAIVCVACLSAAAHAVDAPGEPVVALTQVLAQANDAQPAPPPPSEKPPPTPEQKRKTRSAALLLTVLAGIALTGLLLLIVSISVRGLQRKLAGPTRLDQEPHDLLPDVAADDDSREQEAGDDGEGAVADDTQYT